jgi:hypothetical protein
MAPAIVSVAIAACGGAEGPTEEVSGDAWSVVGGVPDSKYPHHHPSVVEVWLSKEGGVFVCTGSVIGRHTVLTAAHCVMGAQTATSAVHAKSATFSLSGRVRHPKYVLGFPEFDVALVYTNADLFAHGLKRIKLLHGPRQAGSAFHQVGYGEHGGGDHSDGDRYVLKNHIDGVQDNYYTYNLQGGTGIACFGDSGGPALARKDGTDYIFAVDSGGSKQTCAAGKEYLSRVDVVFGWLSARIK